MLATVPLAMVLLIPESFMHESRKLELALILYLAILMVIMKYFPILASVTLELRHSPENG